MSFSVVTLLQSAVPPRPYIIASYPDFDHERRIWHLLRVGSFCRLDHHHSQVPDPLHNAMRGGIPDGLGSDE